jgi:hypothetical protein
MERAARTDSGQKRGPGRSSCAATIVTRRAETQVRLYSRAHAREWSVTANQGGAAGHFQYYYGLVVIEPYLKQD